MERVYNTNVDVNYKQLNASGKISVFFTLLHTML